MIAGNHELTFDTKNQRSLAQRVKSATKFLHLFKFFYGGLEFSPKKYKSMLTNCTYLEDESIEVMGYKVYGSPWSPTYYNWAFNANRGEEIHKKWQKIPTDTDILLTHTPPYGKHPLYKSIIYKESSIKPSRQTL